MPARHLLVALAGLAAACATPPPSAAPPPHVCGWGGAATGDDLVVADLRLRSGQFNRVATAADSAAVAAVGGRVLNAFNVAVLRVEVPAYALHGLTSGPGGVADVASPVRDLARYQVAVQVFFERTATTADVHRAWRAGGAVGAVGGPPVSGGPVVSAVEGPVTTVVEDSLVGRVEALPRVDFVRAEAFVCATPL